MRFFPGLPGRLGLAVLLLLPFAGCAQTTMNTGDGLTARVTLEPGQRFVVGAGDHAPLQVTVRNTGETPADLMTVADETETLLGTLQPEQMQRVDLDAEMALYIVNRSRSEASLQAEIRGDTRVGLRYETID